MIRASLLLLALALAAGGQERPFVIQVVDDATGRGVPLVELETMDSQIHVTDSAGRVAFQELGQMGVPIFFSVRSHGYAFAADGFGFPGKKLTPLSGKRAQMTA